VRQEKKERRKKWAERLTPRQKLKAETAEDNDEMVEDEEGVDASSQSLANKGMLPNDIVNLLAAREKQVFLSDSEDEKVEKKPKSKKKKAKISGVETVILNELPPAHCVQSSLEFLNKRKTQVPRSAAVLTNSNQALRLLSSSGLLK
ncbi:Glycerol-3-phosphate acyltransferase, partial [Bienertia sinuspersici]